MGVRLAYEITGWLWEFIGVLWLAAMFTNKRAVRVQVGFARFAQIGLGVPAAFLMADRGIPVRALNARFIPFNSVAVYAGVAILAAGLSFAIWARVYLGRNWSGTVQVKRNHELMTGGPYALVRHPIYTGLLIGFVGTAIVFRQVRCLLGLALILAAWWMKLRVEERFMTEQFGERYLAYRSRTKALIPWVL